MKRNCLFQKIIRKLKKLTIKSFSNFDKFLKETTTRANFDLQVIDTLLSLVSILTRESSPGTKVLPLRFRDDSSSRSMSKLHVLARLRTSAFCCVLIGSGHRLDAKNFSGTSQIVILSITVNHRQRSKFKSVNQKQKLDNQLTNLNLSL